MGMRRRQSCRQGYFPWTLKRVFMTQFIKEYKRQALFKYVEGIFICMFFFA